MESDQYGVRPLNDCTQFLQAPQYQPVIFYVYSFEQKMIRMTFCQPSLALYNGKPPPHPIPAACKTDPVDWLIGWSSLYSVKAGVDMHTGLVTSVILGDQNVPDSNVTGLPAFNGCVLGFFFFWDPPSLTAFEGGFLFLGLWICSWSFDPPPFSITFNLTNADQYVIARSLSTQTAIPFAIYQGATVQPGGVAAVVQEADGFLNITNTVYVSACLGYPATVSLTK